MPIDLAVAWLEARPLTPPKYRIPLFDIVDDHIDGCCLICDHGASCVPRAHRWTPTDQDPGRHP